MTEREVNLADVESALEDQVVEAVSNSDPGPGGLEQHSYPNLKAYPNEVWGSVFQKLESVHDFARIQRVSKTFYSLVHLNSWTKIRRIEVKWDLMHLVKVLVFTGVPEQKLVTTEDRAPLLLGNLIQKATKTTILHLDLGWVKGERQNQILADLLGALATSLDKIEEFELWDLPSLRLQASLALAQFLNTNAQSLTRLTVGDCFRVAKDVPGQLRRAFQNCTALEYLEIHGSRPFVEYLLPQKPNLKSLEVITDDPNGSIPLLLECGAKLDVFSCRISFLEVYLREVQRQNRSLDHPLDSVTTLKIVVMYGLVSLPWSLLPNLGLFFCYYFILNGNNLVDLLVSYLMHWSTAGALKSLEWRIKNLWKKNDRMNASCEDVLGLAGMVMEASQCQAVVSHNIISIDHQKHTLQFHKGSATIKVLIE